MTLTVLFLGPDLFGRNDLSREDIGLTRTDHLKQNASKPLEVRLCYQSASLYRQSITGSPCSA